MAGVLDLPIDQGETFRWAFVFATRPEVEGDPWVPVDLTGCTARMQVREKYGSEVLASVTTEDGGITLGGADGRVEVFLTDVQTDELGVKEGSTRPRTAASYDIELIFPSGDVKRLIQGAITIDPNITRDTP